MSSNNEDIKQEPSGDAEYAEKFKAFASGNEAPSKLADKVPESDQEEFSRSFNSN